MQSKLFVPIVLVLVACNTGDKSTTSTEKAPENAVQAINTSGYTLEYPSNWSIDPPANVEKILALYKDWDNNTLETSKNSFADSVLLILGDGTVMNGTRDSVIANVQTFRNSYTAMKSNIHSVVGLKHGDTGENWVVIWAREIHTEKSGKTDSLELHEAWRFNKDGKINWLLQYNQPILPPKASN